MYPFYAFAMLQTTKNGKANCVNMSECVLFTIALSIYVVYASILYFAYFQMVMRDDMA